MKKKTNWRRAVRRKWGHCCRGGFQRRRPQPLTAEPPLSSALISNWTPNPAHTHPFSVSLPCFPFSALLLASSLDWVSPKFGGFNGTVTGPTSWKSEKDPELRNNNNTTTITTGLLPISQLFSFSFSNSFIVYTVLIAGGIHVAKTAFFKKKLFICSFYLDFGHWKWLGTSALQFLSLVPMLSYVS